MRWSVLDQSPASAGSTEGAAIRASIALAQHCDKLGYERYWVSEHHNSASIVGTAPEILMAAVAATTPRIRIGSAGVMLPHYSALKVAEQFRVLEAIAPGRIDLGVGRAPGSDGLTAHALNPHANAAEDFPRQVQELQHWVSGIELPAGHPYRSIAALPRGTTSPQIWILGSSAYGAQLAAHFGLPYAFAYFFSDGAGVEEALSLYRRNYRPSERYPRPIPTICVWALAAESEAEAKHLAMTREYWRAGFDKGLRSALVSPETAAAHPYTDAEQIMIQKLRERALVGSGAQVAEKLRALGQHLALDEIVINTWTFDPAARQRSYSLLGKRSGPMIVLQTERLTLRELNSNDAPFILELLNEEGFLRYIGDKGVRDLDDARDYIAEGPVDSYGRNGFGLYASCLKGVTIGICGLVKRDTLPDPDLGFAFLSRYGSQGYAVESARAVMEFGRDRLNLPRIVAITSPDNARSIALLKKVGLKFDRYLTLSEGAAPVRLFT